MTNEQFDRAKELRDEIVKYNDIIGEIKSGLVIKTTRDKEVKRAEETGEYVSRGKWTMSKFFTLKFAKQKMVLVPHYEFARGIEMDAEPELVALVIDYLEKKKAGYEKEFEQIGGADHG